MSNSDSELEEDEEEILVYVEFDNCATNDVFSNENLKLDMLGLDSDHPVMQVNGKFFQGSYEDAVGTYMFFERDDHPTIDDPVFDKIPTLKYFQKTRKLLRMQRAFVTPRYEVVGDSEHSKCIPNMETIKEAGVPPKYQEEAFAFWNESRNNRMNALNEYLKKHEFRKELRARGFEPESDSDEDNPFAVYKHMEEESEISKDIENDEHSGDLTSQIKNLESTLQMTEINKENEQIHKTLNVIDPGPSTSKDSMPWIDVDVLKEQEKSKMLHKVKSVGRVRQKMAKGKVQKKTGKKKTISAVPVSEKLFQDSSGLQFIESTNRLQNSLSKDKIDHLDEDLEKNVQSMVGTEEQMDVDEIFAEENDRLLAEEFNIEIPPVSEKAKRKQEKREAKMREISEKLKAFSESRNQPSNS